MFTPRLASTRQSYFTCIIMFCPTGKLIRVLFILTSGIPYPNPIPQPLHTRSNKVKICLDSNTFKDTHHLDRKLDNPLGQLGQGRVCEPCGMRVGVWSTPTLHHRVKATAEGTDFLPHRRDSTEGRSTGREHISPLSDKSSVWHVSALPGLSLHSPIEVRHTTASRDMPPLSTLATVGTSRAQEVISFLEPSRLTVVRPALRCVAGSRPRHQEMRVHWMRITIRDCNTPSGGAWRPRTACCASIWGCVVIICFGTRHLCTT